MVWLGFFFFFFFFFKILFFGYKVEKVENHSSVSSSNSEECSLGYILLLSLFSRVLVTCRWGLDYRIDLLDSHQS
jgi:hypothetical protein